MHRDMARRQVPRSKRRCLMLGWASAMLLLPLVLVQLPSVGTAGTGWFPFVEGSRQQERSNYGGAGKMHQDAKEIYKVIHRQAAGSEPLRPVGAVAGAGDPPAPPPPAAAPAGAAAAGTAPRAAAPPIPAEEPYSSDDDPILFFAMHDLNMDGYLDGHELLALFAHYDQEEGKAAKNTPANNLAAWEKLVLHSLEEDDLDNDGRISKEELMASEYYKI